MYSPCTQYYDHLIPILNQSPLISWCHNHDKTTPLQPLTTHNNNLSFKHEKQVKNSRKHTLKQEEISYCRNFQQNQVWKRWIVWEGEESGREKKFAEFFPLLPSNWSIYKEKSKVKSNLFDFGEKLPLNPSSSPNYPY